MTELPVNLLKCFKSLSTETKELYLRHEVAEIEKVPTALEFLRDWVSPNMPVLIKGGVSHWPAVVKWNLSYMKETLGSKSVMVAVTPNGYADAITSHNGTEYFTTPAEVPMTMLQLMEALENPDPGRVCYLQRQNSNLTSDLPELLDDIDPDIPWATRAFGNQPDAVNIWIGDSRAVTSMHKDPYENLYCVISGYKDFILHAPTDRPWLLHKEFPQATYRELVSGHFTVEPLESTAKIPWICVDPLKPHNCPLYQNATPVKVRVCAGDILYLPSLWFHHVQQSHGCIAVNFWYDMTFDIKYAYYQLLEALLANST